MSYRVEGRLSLPANPDPPWEFIEYFTDQSEACTDCVGRWHEAERQSWELDLPQYNQFRVMDQWDNEWEKMP